MSTVGWAIGGTAAVALGTWAIFGRGGDDKPLSPELELLEAADNASVDDHQLNQYMRLARKSQLPAREAAQIIRVADDHGSSGGDIGDIAEFGFASGLSGPKFKVIADAASHAAAVDGANTVELMAAAVKSGRSMQDAARVLEASSAGSDGDTINLAKAGLSSRFTGAQFERVSQAMDDKGIGDSLQAELVGALDRSNSSADHIVAVIEHSGGFNNSSSGEKIDYIKAGLE